MTTSATISGQPSPNTVIYLLRDDAGGTSPDMHRRGSRLMPPSVSMRLACRHHPGTSQEGRGEGRGSSGAVPTVTVTVRS
ncbi:hypothetical protein GCM10010517_54110 [Streptosporangium fragile]|uniref:Uncharacterized protein n=1 Tax=Streptosporangium fragile TaxID=46186 RepID=A0ABN3W3Z0_9ACTN